MTPNVFAEASISAIEQECLPHQLCSLRDRELRKLLLKLRFLIPLGPAMDRQRLKVFQPRQLIDGFDL